MAESTAIRRWYRGTFDCLMAILLAMEGFLFLHDRILWSSPSQQQQWTVLILTVACEAAFVSLVLRAAVAASCRLRIPFNPSALVVLAVAFACIWLPGKWQKARNQRETVAVIERAGGRVLYDYQVDENGNEIDEATPPGLPWLQATCGPDFFRNIASVELPRADEAALESIGELRRLRKLSLYGRQITDFTLEYFKGLTRLRRLRLRNTAITDQGLEHLRGMTDLEDLDVSNTLVSNEGIKHLKGLARLRTLERESTRITGDGAVELRQALPGIKISGRRPMTFKAKASPTPRTTTRRLPSSTRP